MQKIAFIIIAFLALACTGMAQRRTVSGFLKDSLTLYPLAGKITNATSKRTEVTDANGYFKMDVAPNDFIFAVAPNYRYDTLSYSMLFTDTITILLASAGTILPNVIVTSRYNKYQLDSIQRKTEFEQDRGTVYNTIDDSHGPGFGVNVNLDRIFKKKYKDKKSAERLFNSTEETAYVDYRFSPQLVNLYTGLKGEQLQKFILTNRPSYEWLRQHKTNEDVLYYINDKLKNKR